MSWLEDMQRDAGLPLLSEATGAAVRRNTSSEVFLMPFDSLTADRDDVGGDRIVQRGRLVMEPAMRPVISDVWTINGVPWQTETIDAPAGGLVFVTVRRDLKNTTSGVRPVR